MQNVIKIKTIAFNKIVIIVLYYIIVNFLY